MAILDTIHLRGGLSETVTSSDFFAWWSVGGNTTQCYLTCSGRDDSKDRIYEKFCVTNGVGPEGVALLLAASDRDDYTYPLREFYEHIKTRRYKPLNVLIDLLVAVGIPVKQVKNDITAEHTKDVEDGIKLLVRLKGDNLRQPLSFEGRYECISDGSNKYWEVKYIGGSTPFRASWGRIGQPLQAYKDYTEAEASRVARDKITNKGYYKA